MVYVMIKLNQYVFGGIVMEQKISLKTNRLIHIDLIETVAIFFVVSYHATKYSFDFLNSGTAVDYLLYFFRTILSTCVPLFFFANGYLLLNKSFDLKRHIKKIFRLLVIVFVWSFLLMILYLLIAGENLTLHAIVVPILNMDVQWGMNLFWYIGALICIYILFPLLKLAFDKDKKLFYFFIIVCTLLTFGYNLINEIVLLLSPFTNAFEKGIELPVVTMFNPFRGSYGYVFVYFCIGGIIGENKEKVLSLSKKKRNIISIFGILVSCVCLFVIGILHSRYIKNEVWDIVWNGYDSIFTLFNVIFIYALCLNFNKENRFISCISKNTMGIYIIHGLLLRLIDGIFENGMLCNLPFNLIFSLAILSICLLISMCMKKTPVLKNLV